MSKNLTRKGLAFGAGIALVASGFAAVPAQADTTGPVTLVPTAGTTFNSILQSGIELYSNMSSTDVTIEEAASLAFLISNPGEAAITATFDTIGTDDAIMAFATDTAPTTSAFTGMAKSNRVGQTTSNGRFFASTSTAETELEYLYVTGATANAGPSLLQALKRKEVQTTTITLTDDDDYVINLPNGTVLNADDTGGESAPTAAEVQGGFRADVDYNPSYATIGVAGTEITITYQEVGTDYPLALATNSTVVTTYATTVTPARDAATFNLGTTDADENKLTIATSETTKNVTLTVQAWLDANGNGKVDLGEKSSDVETVILYAPANAGATTTIGSVIVDTDTVKATVIYGNDINPHMVKARTTTQFLRNGTVVNVDGNTVSDLLPTNIGTASFPAATPSYTKNTLVSGVDVSDGTFNAGKFASTAAAGIYSAVAYYETTASPDLDVMTGKVRMGAPSQVLDLTVGGNSAVDGISAVYTTNANQKETATTTSEIYVRTGTKAVEFGAQITDSSLTPTTLKAANVEVRAVVSGVLLDSTTEVTVSGATGKLVKDGAAITAYARTDSNGKVAFTLATSTGKKLDHVDVSIQYKNSSGVWTEATAPASGLDIQWFDADVTTLTAKPAAYVSGENPVVTFAVVDQWEQPVSFLADTRLSVYASAYLGGVQDVTVYAERVTVVDGEAAFTFANFAAEGATAELRAILYSGATNSVATESVVVYNGADTAEIAVASNFKTNITYNDYVTGSSTDSTVAAALVATGLGADTVRATLAGNVLSTTGAGQPGAAVTLSADGVLFFDSAAKVYALDTITTYANEFGAFTVFAYAHTVNATGATVSITSGTVSASTKLITHLPKDLLTRDNLEFSFDVPATLVMNTTYAVVAKLADKWGNPVQTAGSTGSVSVVGNGSVQVNGVTDATVKDFDLKGEATVFIRSLKDIAGPSSVTATLLVVKSQYTIDSVVDGDTGEDDTGDDGFDSFGTLASTTVDVTGTAWDETTFAKTIAAERDVVETAPAATADQKVNVGSFKGYVALYAKGYAGQKMSAIVAGKWIVVESLASDFERVVRFTGAGYTITTKIYIDGVQVGDAFTTETK